MILVDANLLLYAKISDYPQHGRARAWLEGRLNQPARVGLPWPSLFAFLRIATNPRLFPRPLSPDLAWRQVREWLGRANVWIPLPGERHAEVVEQLLLATRPRGELMPDLHLAALALEHGLKLCSTDGDFARFPGLGWVDPLRAAPRSP